MFDLMQKKAGISREQAAEMLKASPELLKEFETAYGAIADAENAESGNFFKLNSRDAAAMAKDAGSGYPDIADRIVDELLNGTEGLFSHRIGTPVTKAELLALPEGSRPQLTGSFISRELPGPSYPVLLSNYKSWLDTGDRMYYNMFRQGLDILDLDPVTYEMLGMNPNSIGHWFPALKEGTERHRFFKIPETKIVKVPLPILQLTRLDYFSLSPVTLDIVDRWAWEAFNLSPYKEYFIKTGTYSSKFDFRNAKVTDINEIREIGRYLLFIHAQANAMAHHDLSGAGRPCIYGVSTTNEWVVREFIEDKEDLPCIYHGLPLRTEYRAFVDFDKDELMGLFLYWDPDTMKKRLGHGSDADTADMKHDYVIYLKEEQRLRETFDANKERLAGMLMRMIPDIRLSGQWSLDIMQNGDDFWLIDMALAANSALVEKLPVKPRMPEENWLPRFDEC